MAKNVDVVQEIHIPVDAHLGREGFLLKELPEVFKEIKKCKFIKLTGIYAHFANIEDTTNFTHAQKQIKEYERALKLAGSSVSENYKRTFPQLPDFWFMKRIKALILLFA